MRKHPRTRRRSVVRRSDDGWQIRIFHRKAKGTKSARYLLKCGCCDERVEIWYDPDGLEINGVNGTLANWREILMPLLEAKV